MSIYPFIRKLHLSRVLQYKDEATELEELREMKADIERREKSQATVIENQAKRLEELETLYKVTPSTPSPTTPGSLNLHPSQPC